MNPARGNVGVDPPTENQGSDKAESAGISERGREKITTKQNAESDGVVGGGIKVDHARPNSAGSHFARLEIVDEMDGIEMELRAGRQTAGRRCH